MKKTVVFAVIAILGVMSFQVFADDVTIGDPNPIEIDWIGGGETYDAVHTEATPYKGFAEVYVKNTGTADWGDFHFSIYQVGDETVENVHFLDLSLGGVNPTSSQTLMGWEIDNVTIGATIDLYFYNDPVGPGE
ncbi:MAG: hypothetical protein ACYSR3_10120, partial [Planctomycetota bacterium]